MNSIEQRHKELTALRAPVYANLFGAEPSSVFTPHSLFKNPDERFLIDVFVYTLETRSGDTEVAITNGMSDQRMASADVADRPRRREIIQYLRKCTLGHARRLHGMAWLPLYDEFHLDALHSIAWNQAAKEGTPWTSAFFLEPIIRSHQEFSFEIEGDEVSLLWHIPISEEERAYKNAHGADALIDRLDAAELPWIFDETNRPSLLP